MAPKRIQRKRTKGWKMPENTVYVGRPTKYGNPFKPGVKIEFNDERFWTDYGENFYAMYDNLNIEQCIKLYSNYIKWKLRMKPNLIAKLRGKNLACWCKEGEPCHADVLLELANSTN